ncbi:NAD(P)/FAD-dependent oxidoreductase [Herbiconiux sp. CPCC 205716]|uniref:Pyridine nucleotide-disulfide oxidoreductase domain-containing protein 2 n=1 Tax=Herbiconiux gentiana TaxID=2970912 RepID=A0ABT2GBY2_9MICO|nr:NAD(P)/FAD-dependent oxidoreductase [Herbiconiux gentiana]MCS5713714.1 NAD(P)/FAD-dependent oxidoreductase [Herbiconiux gentiana]
MPDVTVVGGGPNGLAAAVTMARAGLDVEVLERGATLGGGARTVPLTLPGFLHDVGSAVHPMGLASPFFRAFELDRRVDFLVPDVSYVHPLPDAPAGVAYRDLDKTAAQLGPDGPAWRRLFAPLVERIDGVTDFTANQLLRVPRDPVTAVRFGLRTLEQGTVLWNRRFRGTTATAMLSGVSAHSIGRMPSLASAGAGMVLAAHAHARGWPIPVGGSQAIVRALEDDLIAHGGRVTTGVEVRDLRALSSSRAVLLDVSASALADIAGPALPDGYKARLRRFAYGDGVAKVDFALSGPVPWSDPEARLSPTLHLGGSRKDIARSEAQVASGHEPDEPYVLVSQPTVLDPSRAPSGQHVLWAYIHVPRGSTLDPTELITRMVERSAPGFRDLVLASAAMSASQLQEYDPNFVGGDISSGALSILQMAVRPTLSHRPWRTPGTGLYLASSSTPPATGVHGLSGFYAARTALKDMFGLRVPELGIDGPLKRPREARP